MLTSILRGVIACPVVSDGIVVILGCFCFRKGKTKFANKLHWELMYKIKAVT